MSRSVTVDLAALDRECARRGWGKADLARAIEAHPDSITDLYRSGRATPRMLVRIAAALARTDPVPGAAELLARSA
jgi:plasmid maintenance system antidote protein VapI